MTNFPFSATMAGPIPRISVFKTLKTNWRKILLIVWGVLMVVAFVEMIVFFEHHTFRETIHILRQGVPGSPLQLFCIIQLLYVLRTFLFLPLGPLGALITLALGDQKALFAFFAVGTGIFVSALLAFGLARALGRKWIEEHETKRLQKFDLKVRERGFFTIIVLRVLIFLPFDVLNWASGFSSIRFKDYFWATLLSVWPEAAFQVLAGGAIFDPRNVFILPFFVLAFIGLVYFFKTHPHFAELLAHAMEKAEPDPEPKGEGKK
jgi:uncharacterized membrane protein YdjX (TVP38/TMEM64 family)